MKRLLAIAMTGLLVLLLPGPALGRLAEGDAAKAEKIKVKIAKLGVGEKAKAQVKLKTGQKLKGYVSSSSESYFNFTEKSGNNATIAYSDVAEVKKPGLSKWTKVAIVGGIAVAVVAVVVVHEMNHLFDDFTLSNAR
jgi:hypothetical protein